MRLARPFVFGALLLAGALLALACDSEDGPPPRSPVADTETPAPTADVPTATPTLPPTVTSTPQAGDPTPPPGQALELVTGNAIELMAEWLGVPVTDLSVVEAEALVWPDACLGIDQPGVACAEVLTPGFRVVLSDAFDGLHPLHADASGRVRWAGESVTSGTIVAVEGAAITLDLDGTEQRLVASPGTRYGSGGGELRLDDLTVGQTVSVAFDLSPTGAAVPVLAWVVVVEGP